MHSTLEGQRGRARDTVRSISADRVLSVPIEDLTEEVFDAYRANPIVLHEERVTSTGATDITVYVQGFDREVPVEGTAVEWHIPFDGDDVLFQVRPSSFTLNPPTAEVRGRMLVLRHEGRAPLDPASVKGTFMSRLTEIEKWLDNQRAELEPFNEQLRNDLRTLIEQRQTKVLRDRELDTFLEVPVPDRTQRSSVFSVDPPRLPTPSVRRTSGGSQPFSPEPAISNDGFSAILAELASVTAAVERLPQTFAGMPEESLRDVLLVVLNNRFGPASGETFSRRGKTDIFIPYGADQRAVFIAECKWWQGPSKVGPAVDQLVGYLTWRDTKAALILFSARADPSAVARKAQEELASHRLFKRRGPNVADQPTFVLHHPDDRNREIEVALLIVPVIASSSGS
ncbi:MAG TPA: hypothetical protein VJ777_05460 [Mycobacterium sp.]|nr:hypothetical protein [Mycobacterium sp.]